MNPRRDAREALGLTQAAAATKAGVSFATYRRWEEDPGTVRESTRKACRKILDREAAHTAALAAEQASFTNAWEDCHYLTPRQAYAIACALEWWADLYLGEWLRDPASQSLFEVSPFDQLDLRVMMLVGENRPWVEMARRRCLAVAEEIASGVLPFDRDGCYFDELLMALALSDAQARLADEPEMFEGIAAREDSGPDENLVTDQEWDAVSDAFDDRCRWDEWELPLFRRHPLLPRILDERHPCKWFDETSPSGPGYLNRLVGIEVLSPSSDA